MVTLRVCFISVLFLFLLFCERSIVHGMVNLRYRSGQKEFAEDRVIVFPEQSFSTNQVKELASDMGAKVLKTFSHTTACIVTTPAGMEVRECVCLFKQQVNIMDAEPDYFIHADIVPNDPDFNQLYGLNNTGQTGGTSDADIDAVEAWDTRTDCSSIVVAVIDSGIDYEHEDLAANIWRNPGEIEGDLIDNDGNGKSELIVDFGPPYGINARYNNAAPWTGLHRLSASPGGIISGDLDGNDKSDLIVDFGQPDGIDALFNNTAPWTGLHHLSKSSGGMVSGNFDGN
ncbi:MAG: hypothetical protein MRK01_02150 [Candidatus Scalindua sp.]|nr:hypothetical protein [Candidatus Scalindua sp.]